MRWVVIAAIIVTVVVTFAVAPSYVGDGEVGVEPVSGPFLVNRPHPLLDNRPQGIGPSWYEAHPELAGLGAGYLVPVVGATVVAVVDARRRG